jgi:DNA recombination protein RmuC
MNQIPSLAIDPLSLLAGVALGALAVAVWALPRFARLKQTQDTMGQTFEALAQQSLRNSQEQFLQLAAEKLKQSQMEGSFDLERRQKSIADLVDPIGKTLKDMETRIEGLGKTGAGLEAQLKTFSDDQRFLREQTQNLVQALRNPAARGRWGEMQLQRAFEMVGFVEGLHYKAQKSVQSGEGTSLKPDFIVTLPNGIQIVIDVKTPLDPYWQMLDQTDPQLQEQTLVGFRQKVRDHLKSLSQKDYWRQFDSPEFVVMFLPSEGLYALAVSQDQNLLEEASRYNVILASPTTIMGLLRVVMYGWQQQKIADEARTVATLASDLYRRISIFGDHMGKLGRSLNGAVEGYNKAVGSMDQMVLPVLRKFRDLQVPTGGKEIPEALAIEPTPRIPSSPELQGDGVPAETAEIIPLKSTHS